MENELVFFTLSQGSFLIRLLLSQLLADFVFLTNSMDANKKSFSKSMLLHIGIVFFITIILSFSLKIAAALAFLHWIIDSIKYGLLKIFPKKIAILFFVGQILHILSILIIWAISEDILPQLSKAMAVVLTNYQINLLIIGYVMVIWPIAYVMKFVLDGIDKTNKGTDNKKLEHGGKLIGMFERIIILTFVYLNKYEAIGFLITGKSIIRFAQKEEGLRSEYVLVGTMMSYALSIMIGVIINWLLGIK